MLHQKPVIYIIYIIIYILTIWVVFLKVIITNYLIPCSKFVHRPKQGEREALSKLV